MTSLSQGKSDQIWNKELEAQYVACYPFMFANDMLCVC